MNSAQSTAQDIARGPMIGFIVFCLLRSSAWLIEAIWPVSTSSGMLPPSAWQALLDAFLAAVLCIAGHRHLSLSRLRPQPWLKLSLAGVLLLGLPAALAAVKLQGVTQVSLTALFALVPVAVVVIVPSLGTGQTEPYDASRMLAFALTGLAGALLLLPVAVPQSWRAVGGLAIVLAVVLLVAVASVWLHRLLAAFNLVQAAIVFCLANAIFAIATFLLTGASLGPLQGIGKALVVEALKTICFDLPQLLLLLWLMREVAPARLAARFLVVPLLTVVEGFLLLRPEITFRSASGGALLLFGTWRLLTGSTREEEPHLTLG